MRSLDLFLDLLDVGAVFALAELLLDRLDLLVQVVLALALFHLAFYAATDALLDLHDVQFCFQQAQQMFKALAHIEYLQHFLFLFQLQGQVCGDGIGQTAGIVDAGQRSQYLRRYLLVQLDVLIELVDQRTAHRLGLVSDLFVDGNGLNLGIQMRLVVEDAQHFGALRPFHQHFDRAVGQLEHLQDVGDAADAIDVFGGRLVLGG